MRNLLIGILLAGAVSTPAFAQDNGQGRWHHDQEQATRGDGHQRQQAPPQPQQQAPRPRFNGGNAYGQQQAPQFVREQQQMQVQQGQRGGWHGRLEGMPNGTPQGVQQQAYGYHGPVQVDRNRAGGWSRSEAYRQNEVVQQQVYGYRGPTQVDRSRNGGWSRGEAYRQNDVVQQQARNGWYGQRGEVQPQYRQGNRYASGEWNRDWRQDRRYDWRRYRDDHRSVFHVGLYIDPFGYGYQPFGIGYRLPPVYFGERYWIDPAMYDLPYPPPGTAWVRYWNDALLVDTYTGQVVDVIQGFFW